MTRMTSSVCVYMQTSSMVPSLGAVLDTACIPYQTAPQTALASIARKLANDLYAFFPYQTTHGQNKPLKRSRTKIKANVPQNQNEKHPIPLPTKTATSPHSTPTFASCTPARPNACTPALVHPLGQRTNGQVPDTKNISFKKTFGYGKRWANEPARWGLFVPPQNRLGRGVALSYY